MPLSTIRNDDQGRVDIALGQPGTSRTGQFSLPALATIDNLSDVASTFWKGLDALSAFVDRAHEITDDEHLSPAGKAAKLAPLQKNAIIDAALRWGLLQKDEGNIATREAALYAVPSVEPSNAAAAITDREVRDWFRSLPIDQRGGVLQQIESDPAQHRNIMVALMRSPIALMDHETKLVSETWRRSKRLEKPDEAVAIDAAKANVEWARRGLLTATAITRNLTKQDRNGTTWSDEQILGPVLTSADPTIRAGFAVFGIDAMRAAQEQRRIDAISIRR